MPRTEVRALTDPVRRDFLRRSATVAAAVTADRLLPSALACADGGPTVLGRPVGLQLYSLRQHFPKDLPGTLAKVYELGFREVEGGGDYGLGIAGFMGALKKAGLILTSALFGYEDWGKDTAAAVRRAREFGALHAGCAWIPHQDRFSREDCLRAAADFNKWGRAAKEAGVRFIYHIHGYEFEASPEGTLFDTLAKETDPAFVAFEADIFWVRRGGADPVALFERYPGRIPLTHLKDIAKGTDICKPNGKAPDETSVPLGSGMIDWPAVLSAAQKAGVERHFIEDEHPEALAQIPQSLRFLAAHR